jgi:hypothetical protein
MSPLRTGVVGHRTILRIGVVGHRSIDDPAAVAREVLRALAMAASRALPRGEHAGPPRLEILSALAEGADRLAARVLLEEPGATLVAILPLARDDYMTDFVSPASKAEFLELLELAARVEEACPAASRDESYERAGRAIVDASDVMLAMWDGEPSRGRGGTAEIIDYARGSGVPVYWIRTNKGNVTLSFM